MKKKVKRKNKPVTLLLAAPQCPPPPTGAELDRMTIEARRAVEKKLRDGSVLTFEFHTTKRDEALAHLAAVNAALWERENILQRFFLLQPQEELAVHREVRVLNVHRARVVAQIDDTPFNKIYRS